MGPVAQELSAAPAFAKAVPPQAFVLDWTDYCNAQCIFCPRADYEAKIGGRGEFIPLEKLKRLESTLRHAKYFGISSAIGEPLLHPELKEILDWLFRINPGLLLRTTTNGTALTAEKAAWFAGHLDWLSVSLNAGTPEAWLRDMFPNLVKRGIDAQKRWDLHIAHLTDFIAALPPEDRSRIRFQAVVHRNNIQDLSEFVRVVARMGGTHAVLTNIMVHPTTVDLSLYWVRDLYNDAIDEAREVGAQLGVRVDAARFFTSVKPVLDLDAVCRDPVDTAYISRGSRGAPCCQWAEPTIPTEVYEDEHGFDRYWNNDVFRRLRQKRDFVSCRACGMSRVFDEASFHFSGAMKEKLSAEGRLLNITADNDYPDAGLVRRCADLKLDLVSIRRTLLRLNLPVDLARPIETEGLAALPRLDRACWEAYCAADLPADQRVDVPLAGTFLGIGWGIPIIEAQNQVSARIVGGAQAASIFVRVPTDLDFEIRMTIHHAHPEALEAALELAIDGVPIETMRSRNEAGRAVLSGKVPHKAVRAHGGRLWLQVGCFNPTGELAAGQVAVMRLEMLGKRRSPLAVVQSVMRAVLGRAAKR